MSITVTSGKDVASKVNAAPFYVDHRHFAVWENTQLILDVGEGAPEGFSLVVDETKHFITRSGVLSTGELVALRQGDSP